MQALPSAVPTAEVVSERLAEVLLGVEDLVLGALIGSVASATERADSDIDLLLVADVSDEGLYLWRRERLSGLYALEKELGRELHVTAFTHTHFLAEAARPSGFLTTLVARPHRPLFSSLEHELPATSLALLRERALAFLTRLEHEGNLAEPYRQGLSALKGRL